MAEFQWHPIDPKDVDIHEDPNASVTPHLGAKRALFAPTPEDAELITSGEMYDKALDIIDTIRPYIKEDNGDVEVLGIKDGWLQLKFMGECGSCGASASTLLEIEQSICEEIPEMKGVTAVQD